MTASSKMRRGFLHRKSRPHSVTLAALLQVLIGVAFLSIAVVGLIYSSEVQTAVEAEVVRQGLPAVVLAENNIAFDENGAAIVMPIVVALGMTTLALCNVVGKRIGLLMSWIFQPIILLGNFAIVASQLAVVQTLKSVFDSSGNAQLQSVDVQVLVDAAYSAYPGWLPVLVNARNVVVMFGSVLVIGLLVLAAARAYFRNGQVIAK